LKKFLWQCATVVAFLLWLGILGAAMFALLSSIYQVSPLPLLWLLAVIPVGVGIWNLGSYCAERT